MSGSSRSRGHRGEAASDEDRLTLARRVDLRCPSTRLTTRNSRTHCCAAGLDEQRPTLALALPRAGSSATIGLILVGTHDTGSGLDAASFSATADFAIDGAAAGTDLANEFKEFPDGRREWKLKTPMSELPWGRLTVSVTDRRGHVTRIERTFSVPAR